MDDKPLTAEQILDTARRAERWIHTHEHATEHGVVWGLANEVPTKRFHNLYSGSAGISLFYLELHQALGDAAHLNTAQRSNGVCASIS